MNDQNPVPPPGAAQTFASKIYEPLPPPPLAGPRPLGDDPSERVPITSIVAAIDAILRHPRRVMFQLYQPGAGKLIGMMVLVAVACSLIYGVVVGTFSGHDQFRPAPAKISTGLMISALICLPSLYIFTCLSGLQARLA